MFPNRVHETIQNVSYSILKAVLSSILCMYEVRFRFCYHCIDWLVERPYELMIDFCSDPSHTSDRDGFCECPAVLSTMTLDLRRREESEAAGH